MSWLFDQGQDFILWNMNYDARALCAYLPKTVLKKLRRSGRAEHRGYRITWKGKKSFAVHKGTRGIRLWDLFPFYQCSLDKAASDYLNERKLGIPRSWLRNMLKYLRDPKTRRRVIRYGIRDAALTQRLWEIVEAQCIELGVLPYRASSPATIAKRAFADAFKKLSSNKVNSGNRIFQKSFYGGRTEIYQRGNVGRVYAYDIHSAYPSVLASVPDPSLCKLARWTPGDTRKPATRDVAYGSYRITAHIPLDDPIPPLPYRCADDSLIFPTGVFHTWTDATTLRLLREYRYTHKVHYGLEWILDRGRKRLFPDISRWYRVRQQNPALKLAAKIVLNSLYGKCAEQIRIKGEHRGIYIDEGMIYEDGKYWRTFKAPARHTCFAVASAITAGCREIAFRAMRHAPQSIVACHTDGILSRVPLPLRFGDAMGTWGREGCFSPGVVVGCGVATFKAGAKWKDKIRGIPGKALGKKGLRSIFNVSTPEAEITVQHARTLHESRRKNYSQVNKMEDIPRCVNANMDRKRVWPRDWQSFKELAGQRQVSEPIILMQPRAVDDLFGG
jgi:hypothetical protein